MKSLLILGCLFFAAVIILALAATHKLPDLTSLRSLRRACGLHAGILRVNALTDGTHADGKLGHLLADAALTTRYLLVKTGSDAGHFAANGATDKPLGVCLDEPSAAEEPATVALLGAFNGTVLMVGSEAIAAGADVYTAASGKVQNDPAATGTVYLVGRAVTACTGDGLTFEVTPCLPQKVTTVANGATLATTQAAMADGAIVIVL